MLDLPVSIREFSPAPVQSSTTLRIGLVRNPRSRCNRIEGDGFRKAAAGLLGPLFFEPRSRSGIADAVCRCAQQEVNLLVIDGGDGTVRDVMNALPMPFGHRLPALAVLPSGNTNLIANNVGFGARGIPALRRLVAGAADGSLGHNSERLHCLAVQRGEISEPPLLGMFMGAAAFTRAVTLARRPRIRRRFSHRAAVLATIASALGQMACPTTRSAWLDGEPMTVTVGNGPSRTENRFLFLATTLSRLMLGAWPFWDEQAPVREAVRFLDVTAHPPRLLSATWSLLRGQAAPWLRRSEHYRSGSARQIALRLAGKFVLDGEMFAAGEDETIRLSLGPAFEFVRA